MPKVTIAALQRQIAELEESREKTNIALGLYRTEGLDGRIKKIEELKKYEREDRMSLAGAEVANRATETQKDKEIGRLWYLVRALANDPTLLKQIENEHELIMSGNIGRAPMGQSPFPQAPF